MKQPEESLSEMQNFYFVPKEKIDAIFKKLNAIESSIQENKKSNPLKEWLTEKETKKLLSKGSTTLWKLRTANKIIAKKIGGSNYYSAKSIQNYLEKQ